MKLTELFDGKKQRRRIKSDRRKIVWNRDGKRCRYCNSRVHYKDMEVDHIKPVSKGGNDYIFNLACACKPCNRKRSNKEWVRPSELPFWRKIFEKILILWYMDTPEIEDYV